MAIIDTLEWPPSALAAIERLTAENERLREERDLWNARALAMFWKLPGEMTTGELQEDAKRALEFVRANQQEPSNAPEKA